MIDISSDLFLILAAAGTSSRMGSGCRKQYLSLKHGTVLSESCRIFLLTAHFKAVIITCPINEIQKVKDALYADNSIKELLNETQIIFIEGGETRQKSVYKALVTISNQFVNKKESIVLIHDAARPFVTQQIISDVITTTKIYGAAVPVIPAVDTQKKINSDNTICTHLVRKEICAVQTPQGFLLQPLFECHKRSAELPVEFTDDTEIWDNFLDITSGKKVHTVMGNTCNKKITYQEDIMNTTKLPLIHVGIGTDIHKVVKGTSGFFIGGVKIDTDIVSVAHSDGDALLHAIADSLLGASGLGDIGSYFPPDDPQWKNADSSILLKTIWHDVKKEGWTLINLDCVVEFDLIKILPLRKKIITSIANILDVDETQVFVKGKTSEGIICIEKKSAGIQEPTDIIKTFCTSLLKYQSQE